MSLASHQGSLVRVMPWHEHYNVRPEPEKGVSWNRNKLITNVTGKEGFSPGPGQDSLVHVNAEA